MDPFSFLLGLSPVRKAIAAGVTAAFLMGIGAVAWEHTPFIGPKVRVERLKAKVIEESGNATFWRGEASKWQAAQASCEALRLSERDDGAQGVTDGAQRASDAARSAFNAGYDAGKTAGRAACPKGDTNAPASDPAAGSALLGVPFDQDFAASFNATRYTGGPVRP